MKKEIEVMDLRLCPCCKSKKVCMKKTFPPTINSTNSDSETTGYYVECYACGLRSAAWGAEELAGKYWNKRADGHMFDP